MFECRQKVSLVPPEQLCSQQAKYYMLHGAGRRLGAMFEAYRSVVLTAHEGRTNPLGHDEQQAFSRDINIIYMNLRGVLDNFAWCLMYERQPDVEQDLGRQGIDLFSKKISSDGGRLQVD